MPNRDVVVIGASAGALDTLRRFVGALPGDLPASLFIVRHVSADSPGILPSILQQTTGLRVFAPADNSPIEPGCVYVAPPDRHLLLRQGLIRVVRGPKENRHRPAIDPLFRSAAWAYGPRVVGVVLSGTLDDGVAGLWAVKTCGGVTMVQDPAEAPYPEMPTNALRTLEVDHCMPIEKIAQRVSEFARTPAANADNYPVPDGIKVETEFAMMQPPHNSMESLGTLAPFTCPQCQGSMWEMNGDVPRYRCHTGHAFSADSLLTEQGGGLENALYSALRVMEEKAALLRRMAERFGASFPGEKTRYETKASEQDRHIAAIRQVLAARSA
jgi:two-component system, chemotaxis family, protein-glutamate methylesterase/glutaminase